MSNSETPPAAGPSLSQPNYLFTCPVCQAAQPWRAEAAGRPIQCACGQALQIPFCPGEALRANPSLQAAGPAQLNDAAPAGPGATRLIDQDGDRPRGESLKARERAARRASRVVSDRTLNTRPCPNCGSKLSLDWKECPDCGYRRKENRRAGDLPHADSLDGSATGVASVDGHVTDGAIEVAPHAGAPRSTKRKLASARLGTDGSLSTELVHSTRPFSAYLAIGVAIALGCSLFLSFLFCQKLGRGAVVDHAAFSLIFLLIIGTTAGLAQWMGTVIGGGLYPFGPPGERLYAQLLLLCALPLTAGALVMWLNPTPVNGMAIGWCAALGMLVILLSVLDRLHWGSRTLLAACLTLSQLLIMLAFMAPLHRLIPEESLVPNFFWPLLLQSGLNFLLLAVLAAVLSRTESI